MNIMGTCDVFEATVDSIFQGNLVNSSEKSHVPTHPCLPVINSLSISLSDTQKFPSIDSFRKKPLQHSLESALILSIFNSVEFRCIWLLPLDPKKQLTTSTRENLIV